MTNWKQERLKNQNAHAEKIAKLVKSTNKLLEPSQSELDKINNEIIDIIYDCLTKNFSLTYKEANEVLGKIKNEKPSDKLLKKLLYDKDGKTLEERVKIAAFNLIKLLMILDTECQHSHNILFHDLAKKLGYVACSVEGEYGCESNDECCDDYFDEIYLLEDAPMPPFHPNCGCELEYYMIDELRPEDIERLGLKELLEQGDVE